MVQGHFWSRVTNRLRGHRSGAPVEWTSDPTSGTPNDDASSDARGDGATLIAGKSAAIRSLDGLHRTQEKVVSLIESIQTHLVAQQDRTARMAEALDRLADSVSQLPRASSAQAEAITALAGQLESTAVRTRRLDNHLAQLPELVEQQRRTDARGDGVGDDGGAALPGGGRAGGAHPAGLRGSHAAADARAVRGDRAGRVVGGAGAGGGADVRPGSKPMTFFLPSAACALSVESGSGAATPVLGSVHIVLVSFCPQ